MEKNNLKLGLAREKEKAKIKVNRVENDMGKMRRINQILITSNDIKERIIAELKEEVIQKQQNIQEMMYKLGRKKKELDFYKQTLGPYY